MPQPNKNVSSSRKGMNRDKNPIDLTETEYSFSLNSNIASEIGDSFFLQDEPSNLLCNNFPTGFAVIGRQYDVNSNRTYFFSTNSLTKVSEIGYINNLNTITNADDVETECNCNVKEILAEPLEGQTQPETCEYITLLNDECNLCLNFSINKPIRKIIVKYEFTGTTLWWTDGVNPMRYLDVGNITQYLFTGTDVCGEDNTTPTCLDCEKLRVAKEFEQPTIQGEAIQQGGSLRAGAYEVLIAYSDLKENEISSYYSNTNPIHIFDPNNVTITQPELEYVTNQGIRLIVDNLDTRYPYYKIAIAYTGGINGTTYYSGGVYSTSDKEITISSLQGLQPISISRLLVPKKVYEKADGLTSSNGTLFWHGTTEQEEINFQPCANLLGAFLRWQTVETTEDLYKDGVNNSLYKSNLRDEVYPYAIQLLFDNGFSSADFPLINRPPTQDELTEISNTDTQSLLEYGSNCSNNERTKKWQFYNTATDEGYYGSENLDNYNLVDREVVKTCTVSNVYTEETLEINVDCSVEYEDIFQYIERYRVQICNPDSPLYNSDLCDIISDTYAEDTCNLAALFDTNCQVPAVLVPNSTQVYLDTVEEETSEIEYIPAEDLVPTQTPNVCLSYKAGSNSQGYENDTVFEAAYMDPGEEVFKRNSPGTNNACFYASPLTPDNTPIGTTFLEYQGSTVLTDLQTSKTSDSTGDFTAFVHTKALWYKIVFGTQSKLILELTKRTECEGTDDIPIGSEVRITTFNDCTTNTHTSSEIVDLNVGELIELDLADYPSGEVFIAVDSPINTKVILSGTVHIVSPPCGCFAVVSRSPQCSTRIVTLTNPVFSKRESYSTTCQFRVPVNTGCEPAPYKFGKFGYWESTQTYPDNSELYDSSGLVIDLNTMPNEFVAEFRDYYMATGELNANFVCQPIRHYRFPDFTVAPFMSTDQLTPFSDSFIYPIGVTLNEDLVNYFLDVAVASGLLTQEQRDKVVGYKIKVGDRTLHKSIIAKGLANDMFSYTEIGASNPEPILFPNFPYNDNHENILLHADNNRNSYIQHPYAGLLNHNFTFHSPETSFGKPTIPSELKIEAYQFGFSRGNFVSVEDHVKEVVLGKDAYTTATTLAIAESVLEIALNTADLVVNASSNLWVTAGTSSGTSAGGYALATAAAIAYVIAAGVGGFLKVGQYRKQWLDIINDLGQPKNFASFYTSVGKYNYAIPNTTLGQSLRAIKTNRYLKPGNYQFTEEYTGDTIKINNRDRESSVFLSTGIDFPLVYPTAYSQFDDSRTIASESVGCENTNISSTAERQVASAYFSLKNYVPDQYGEIGNIKWISTGYTGDLRTPLNFPQIFGGDIYISRFAKKIKHPIFKTTAMNLADRTPFNYTIERNVGVPRFYGDFYTTIDGSLGSVIFPDLGTDYNFDCLSGSNSTYVKNPSKFYLYYYGIPYFLVESEINVNYRFAKTGEENNFYPNTEDFINWTQENNVPIREDNTYFYNNVYSKKPLQLGNRSLPVDYSAEYYRKITYQPNQTFWSMQDNSELDKFEPWLAYKPLDFYQFKAELGRLIDLADIESAQVIGRFENGLLRYNAIDVLRERITPQNQELGTGGIFAQRPLEFKRTKLGYTGTQHVEMVSCEYGHFWADAKRGQVFQLDQNGEQIKDITEGLTRWFKEQLPFKILKYIPNAEIDNNYFGVGLAMVWDSKYKRVFLTKRDFIPIGDCVQYDEDLGYVFNETLCGGPVEPTCPEGYTYNEETQLCEKEVVTTMCPEGYEYNPDQGNCVKINTSIIDPCPPAIGYFTGGVFISPTRHLYNSVNPTVIVENGNIRVLKRQNDGKILVGGSFTSVVVGGLSTAIRGLFRMNFDGTYDNTFNIGTGFTAPTAGATAQIRGIDVYPDGSMIVVGDYTAYKGETGNNGIIKLTDTGDKDLSFFSGTGFTSSIGSPATGFLNEVKIVEGDKILVTCVNQNYKGIATKGLVKILSNGDVDPTFLGGSRFNSFSFVSPINGSNNNNGQTLSIALQPNGDYIIGGGFNEYNGILSRRILRLKPNGDLDTTFAVGEGFLDIGTSSQALCVIDTVQMQNGKILAAGKFKTYKGQNAQGIVRLELNGNLDPTFNNDKVMGGTDFTGRAIYDFDTDNDGEILIGGDFTEYDGNNIPFITLTDENGFALDFEDPEFDDRIFSVLNQPRCESCPDDSCTQEVLETGQIACNCPEYYPAVPCNTPCENNNGTCTCIVTVEPTIEDVLTPIDVSNPNYFQDVSWTAAYSPITQSWVSYYSFKPNYYVGHQDYFQSGLNYGAGKGLWSHLLTNRSYRVFYTNLYPWIVETPVKSSLDKKILSNLNFIVDSERYHNEYDSAPFPKIGFNEMVIYNATNNSNLVKMVSEEKNNMYQKTLYPITNTDSQEVLVTKYDDMFHVNYFYNRIKSEENNIPVWIKDSVDVEKILNQDALTYKSPLPERMKGNWFLVRYYKTTDSQIKSVYKFNIADESLYS